MRRCSEGEPRSSGDGNRDAHVMSIKLQLPKVVDLRPRITVVGVGGAGGNAVNNMIAAGLTGVDFVVANTDAQALLASSAEHRVQLGTNLTEGLGAGSRPEIGEAAAEEAIEDIRSQVQRSHMIFVAAGMGGGTGTGAAAVIARVAKEAGVLVVGIVTKPFQFEGVRRMRIAEAGIAELKKHVDTLIVIPNQNLFRIANEKTTFAEAFVLADQVLYSGISCIVDLIVKEGLINLDFADVRTILSGMGTAMMGTGEASGDRRAIMAAEEAVANPLLDEISLKGAKGLLLSIIGGRNLTLYEVDEAASRVRQEVDAEANIIVGATFDESLGDRVRVSIVASGMNRRDAMGAPGAAHVPQQASHQSAPVLAPLQHPIAGAPPLPTTQPPQGQARSAAGAPAAANVQPQQQRPASRPQGPAAGPSQAAPRPQVALPPAATTARPPHHPQAEADVMRQRLTQAIAEDTTYDVRDDESQYDTRPDAGSTIAGAPWRAPGDVYIEEGLPHLPGGAPPPAAQRGQPQQPAGGQPPPGFVPAPPNDVRRSQQRRMPELGDFPPVGQRDYLAKVPPAPGQPPSAGQPQQAGSRAAGSQPASDAKTEARDDRRKLGFFERLTGRGRRAQAEPEPARPASDSRRPAEVAPQRPQPTPAQRPQTAAKPTHPAPEPVPQKRAAAGGQGVDVPVFFSRDGK